MEEIKDKSGLNLLGWFFGLNTVWILLAVFAAFLGWRSYTLNVNGEVVTGAVVGWVEEDIADAFTDIYPVVAFKVDGGVYSVRSQNNYRWWNKYTRFPIGKQVKMRYDPADPEKAEINSWLDLWGEPIILGAFAIVIAVFANMFLFLRLRSLRRPPKAQTVREL
jgi:hypothetical protein